MRPEPVSGGRRAVVLLTDFGAADWYVAAMKGVLLARAPEAVLVDLTHEVPPGEVRHAAFVLDNAWRWFAAGTVFLVVVDPGVGTERRALGVRAAQRYFIGPDNGALSSALDEDGAECRELDAERFALEGASRTFHGRDLFAPAAAHLAAGGDFDELGPACPDPVHLSGAAPLRADGRLVAHVVHVDRFGNCITDCAWDDLESLLHGGDPSRLRLRAGGAEIHGLLATYGHAPRGEACALFGSSGRLEIAISGGHAAARLGLGVGGTVEISLRPA